MTYTIRSFHKGGGTHRYQRWKTVQTEAEKVKKEERLDPGNTKLVKENSRMAQKITRRAKVSLNQKYRKTRSSKG